MVKKYIEGETKDERKLRKAKEKAEKLPNAFQDDADDFPALYCPYKNG